MKKDQSNSSTFQPLPGLVLTKSSLRSAQKDPSIAFLVVPKIRLTLYLALALTSPMSLRFWILLVNSRCPKIVVS